MKKKLKLYALGVCLWAATINPQIAEAAGGAANLNQARNGTDTVPVNPMNWVNGNMGTGTAHYVEGMSAPYQCIMTSLTAGVQVTLVIGYDIRNSGRNAFDYLTHYNRILPHNFNVHSTPETILQLAGTGLAAGTPYTTYAIPSPSTAGSPVAGQPLSSFNALASDERIMTLYNGTIDSIYYVVQGSLTASNSETQIALKFTPAAATAVFLWGGHIGSRNDWGYTAGIPNSAGGISGSPFHMRLVSWTLNNLGSTDRSLSGATVGAPPPVPLPVELVHFSVSATGNTNSIEWITASEINNDYFALERSEDALTYSLIATVKGAGNSTVTKNYSWNDDIPLKGVGYYRLVQTDFDGAQRIYGPLSIRRNETTEALTVLPAYPNPFEKDFTISYSSAKKGLTYIDINDAGGNRIAQKTVNATSGANSYRYAGLQLTAGIYFITISQTGEKPVTTVVIKE